MLRYCLPCWLILVLIASAVAGEEYPLTIRGEETDGPVFVEIALPKGADARSRWWLSTDATPKVFPHAKFTFTQPCSEDPQKLFAIVAPDLLNRQVYLRQQTIDLSELPVVVEDHGDIELTGRPATVLGYHSSLARPPEGIDAIYSRSGHIHPLWTPAGQIVTSEFPADHPHQHGLFFAWVKTQYAGHSVDFWNQGARLGTVRHKQLTRTDAGPLFSGFEAELEHVDLTSGERVVLQETWRVKAFGFGDKESAYHLIDLESQQRAVTDEPLLISKYHYGGFGWRGPEDWLLPKEGSPVKGCTFLTSLGDDRIKGNHTRPDWVAVTGEVGHRPCTVAIFGSPSNFRHPQPVRLHPDKPYFCFAPCVLGEFPIERDKPLVSRYRIVTHAGPARPELYSQLVKNWSLPVTVEWQTPETP